ncbi:hypothetical protein NESM_000763400 [Novymonas esmeraldas]|uniref:Uncharacterized protein n=1 Tax=Novymonas esmeraldas TaxID=1808958 RepID=A0AAW0EV18_9TRYP
MAEVECVVASTAAQGGEGSDVRSMMTSSVSVKVELGLRVLSRRRLFESLLSSASRCDQWRGAAPSPSMSESVCAGAVMHRAAIAATVNSRCSGADVATAGGGAAAALEAAAWLGTGTSTGLSTAASVAAAAAAAAAAVVVVAAAATEEERDEAGVSRGVDGGRWSG